MFSKTRVTEPGPRAYPQDSEVNRPVMDTKPDFPAAPQAMRPRSGPSVLSSDLTVKGKLNVDEIDLTKNGIVGDNNVTASTKVAAGEITGYKKATSTKDGSEKESAIDYDENSTSTWAKATDADGNWNKSTLTVEGSDVTSKVVDSEKNSNLFTQTSTQSQSTLTDKDNNTNVLINIHFYR